MRKNISLLFILILFIFSCSQNISPEKPNIIIIYADDLGYADLGCYGAVGVETPNIDLLAEKGIKFTDSHSGAATCTPSRFTLLTGSYAFRNKAKILPGDAPLLIRPETPTLPGMLKKNGYTTGVVGKWHLGLGNGNVDWNTEIKPGPREIGFDYSYIIPATGDRVPCVFIEDDKVVGSDPNDPITVSYYENVGKLPTGLSNPELLKQHADTQHSGTIINGISRIGYMNGGEKSQWVDEEFPNILTSKAKRFINENKNNHFFLYFAYHDIHVPRVPNKAFAGKSAMGPRGDAIAQMDWCTGEIIKELNELGIEKKTLVIFTSDNGPVLDDGYSDEAVELIGDHNPSGPFRGGKYSAFEAGTRVPAIVYWPGYVKNKNSDALWSQVDLYASIAELVGYDLNENEAPDSFNVLDAILGRANHGKKIILEEAFTFAIRNENWKYIAPFEGGVPEWMANKDIEPGLSNKEQLFNLNNDIGEQRNLAEENPEMLNKLRTALHEIISSNWTRQN